MKPLDTGECKIHISVCTNEKPNPKACCKNVGGQEFYQKLKDKLKATGLSDTLWVTRSGCLGFCNTVGATVAIHEVDKPSRWFNEVKMEDFDRVWEEITKS